MKGDKHSVLSSRLSVDAFSKQQLTISYLTRQLFWSPLMYFLQYRLFNLIQTACADKLDNKLIIKKIFKIKTHDKELLNDEKWKFKYLFI